MASERALHLGGNIRRYRVALGLSQEKLGQAVGVSNTTVSHWEAGDYSPNLFKVQRLADLFGVSIDVLMSATPCMP